MAISFLYPTGLRTSTGAYVGIYTLPTNHDMYIKFYKEWSYHNLEVTFHFSVHKIDASRFSFHNSITIPERVNNWAKNIHGLSPDKYGEVMKLRGDIINELYDLFRLHMCIGTDDMMKEFFSRSAYISFFNDIDRPPNSPIRIQEKKPEPIDTTPPEVKSALHLHEKGIGLKNKIYQDMREYQREVSEHYKKYGTLWQRSIEHIKSLFLK